MKSTFHNVFLHLHILPMGNFRNISIEMQQKLITAVTQEEKENINDSADTNKSSLLKFSYDFFEISLSY